MSDERDAREDVLEWLGAELGLLGRAGDFLFELLAQGSDMAGMDLVLLCDFFFLFHNMEPFLSFGDVMRPILNRELLRGGDRTAGDGGALFLVLASSSAFCCESNTLRLGDDLPSSVAMARRALLTSSWFTGATMGLSTSFSSVGVESPPFFGESVLNGPPNDAVPLLSNGSKAASDLLFLCRPTKGAFGARLKSSIGNMEVLCVLILLDFCWWMFALG
mmetsp:Transcript_34381/g.71588  ORF Transcript_34381/g.71588 Transcript_34381/m.71588 type:complete len:219 (-) Transcript_34381:34-690(-)